MESAAGNQHWQEVLDFWFPEGGSPHVDAAAHRGHWSWRMRGGADEEVRRRFSERTAEAAAGKLDHWAGQAEGRLALIIVLDQFSRSVWRDNPRAYAQDPAALGLAMAGLSNGHYEALSTPWFKCVFGLPLGHCEGPDHLARMDLLIRLREDIALHAPNPLQPIYQTLLKQARDTREIIARFGRHPHRNQLLGRPSSPEEAAYIAERDFPHLRVFQG